MSLLKHYNNCFWQAEVKGGSRNWVNSSGSWHAISPDHDDVKNTEYFELGDSLVAEFNQQRQDIEMFQNTLEDNIGRGFITPDGKFYSCSAHLYLLQILEVTDKSLDEDNWINVCPKHWQASHGIDAVTSEQAATLRKIGRDSIDLMYINRDLAYEDVYPEGNPDMEDLYKKLKHMKAKAREVLQPVHFETNQDLFRYVR